jgi:hypothetical protein
MARTVWLAAAQGEDSLREVAHHRVVVAGVAGPAGCCGRPGAPVLGFVEAAEIEQDQGSEVSPNASEQGHQIRGLEQPGGQGQRLAEPAGPKLEPDQGGQAVDHVHS